MTQMIMSIVVILGHLLAYIILLLAFACLVNPYDGCFVSTVECSQSAL